MPNWKKIVTSGSDATLNSLNVTSGVTGSLLGTASYASNLGGFDSTYFVDITSSQTIEGTKTFIPIQSFGQFGAANGKLFLYGVDTGNKISIEATGLGDLTFLDQTGSTLATLRQDGTGFELLSGSKFYGDLFGNADTATTASFAITASYALNTGTTINTGSFATTGSNIFIGDQTITGSLNVTQGITGSLLGTASYATQALSASNTDTLDGLDITNFVRTSTNQTITGEKSFRNTTYFGLGTSSGLDGKVTFVDGTNDLSMSISIDAESNLIIQNAEDLTLVTIAQNGDGISLASGTFTGNLTGNADTATTASYVLNAVSSSFSTTASFASNIASGLTISASNLLVTDTITANNIIANSASFGYVETISGSAVIIGQEYIVLNTQSPAARFAGLQIYDSGSASTSSIVWDSLNNKFIYSNASGSTYNGGGFMAGPRNTGSLGDETFPTLNKILRGQGGDHLYDSNITDDNTNISISIPVIVTGSFTVTTGSNVELQVLNTGVRLGNIITDAHTITGSLGVSGSLILTGSAANTLQVRGSGSGIASTTIQARNGAGTTLFTVRNDGKTVVGSNSGSTAGGVLTVFQGGTGFQNGINFQTTANDANQFGIGASSTSVIQIGFNAGFWSFVGNRLGSSAVSLDTNGYGTFATGLYGSGIDIQGTFTNPGAFGFGTAGGRGGNSFVDSVTVTANSSVNNTLAQFATLFTNRTVNISGSHNTIASIVLNSTFNQTQAISTGSIIGINHMPVLTSAYNYRAFDFGNTTAYTPNAGVTNYIWSRISSNISASVNSQQITGLDITLSGSNAAFTGVTRNALRLTTQNINDNALSATGRVVIVGSGSAQPILTVQGSQGELFSVTDSLSGSLFSVNDISGLPIMEVFSDNTILIGDYQDPMLLTTKKVTQTNSGSFIIYSIPTASYDGAFIDYTIKSGSNARAGTIMSTWANSSIEFTEVDTMDIGSTTAVSLTMILSGSNVIMTGSSSTGTWTIRTIIRAV